MAQLLERWSDDIDTRAQIAAAILQSIHHPEAGAFVAQVHSVIAWASQETVDLHWRAEAIHSEQQLGYSRGIPDVYVDEVRDRALIAAFVPCRFDLEGVYDA